MELVTIGLLLALEALVLLAALAVVLGRRQRNLRQQLEQLSKRDQAEPGFASVESGYLAFLETQIVDTRARLELAEAETAADGGFLEALSNRLVLLESEKKVAELCNDYPARRWEHIRACFVPFIEQAEAAAPAPAADREDGELDRLRKRIQSLEKFRGHFFSLKKQVTELEGTRQRLVEQLETLLPEAQRSEQLQALLTEMAEQKRRLQDDMDALDAGPADAQSGAEPAQDAEPDSAPHIGTLQTALSGQVNAIQSLQHLLLQARQEPDQTLIEEMEKHIAQLERQCREANTCVEIMEQENQRLQHRVERAGLRADRAAADSRESVAELQQQLDKKKRTITELHERLVSLKLEAEQAQALRSQVERLERTSRDMAMCVETLEEENEFLQEQIRALLQLDQDQTVYQADDSTSGAPAQDELHKLQEEIRTRDEKLKALEEKYAAMEQEYLTLYEEANA
ncbi:MAG: hypothetical protein JSU62_05315 [Gammaproteobacteria bacterium]|nr:MAG: hypothetical protein JSU62_05315 [Gammaproteobacteria bacterium]